MYPGWSFEGSVMGVGGVMGVDAAEMSLSPCPLVAKTVTVYAVPFVKPVMVHDVVAVVQVAPPGEAVAVYSVMALSPSSFGAFQTTVT